MIAILTMGCNSGRIMVGGHDQNTGYLDDLHFIVQAHGQADLDKHRSEDDGCEKVNFSLSNFSCQSKCGL
jgi:hypothetical protein